MTDLEEDVNISIEVLDPLTAGSREEREHSIGSIRPDVKVPLWGST